MSESFLGFFGFINDDETLMRTHFWSEKAMEECAIDFKPVEFSLVHAGIWAEAIRMPEPLIINDYLRPDPRKKGYPEGHVRINRLMSIPIVKAGKAVAIAAVANKEKDYDESDILHISLFIESMWDVLKRKEVEEKLRKLNEEARTEGRRADKPARSKPKTNSSVRKNSPYSASSQQLWAMRSVTPSV